MDAASMTRHRCITEHRAPTRQAAAPAVALAALALLTSCRHSEAWRKEQEVVITAAIVRDLVAMPGHDAISPGATLCVYGPPGTADRHDPQVELLTMLRRQGLKVHPASECRESPADSTDVSTVFVGLESLDWKDDAFVKAEGEKVCGFLCGGTWLYTLSRSPEGWTVDTVRRHKIF
jgi:hypothetical protein